MNNKMHVEENVQSPDQSKNLYKFLVNERVMKPKAKVTVGSKSKNEDWTPNVISKQERAYRREVGKL